ncbi:hypothetical protein [Flavobacterium sp. DG2-3]|uniref:hypothetical protein n=1 Tax=Flavobacterium sp. DG2-3 TaxID=3068317 RepID=UPI00273E8983|nr:hypothetical protein [Flavobacterium sp. DG2-3]MDP5201824.1 hypothetical protein [Flavobacterium sp. DG2-3]
MRTIKIYCIECEVELTQELLEIPEKDLCWDENKDIMPKNNFSIVINGQSKNKSIMVSIDNYNLKDHSDKSRFLGCCGSSNFNSLNKVCVCGNEVASEISDCWLSHYIEFNLNKVIIKEKTQENYFRKIIL